MDGIINFTEFLKNKEQKELPKFNKEEIMKDFFIEENLESTEIKEVKEEETKKEIVETKEEVEEKEEKISEKVEEPINESIFEEDPVVEYQQPKYDDNNFYKLYKDKSEVFSCEIELEGANLKDTEVRLIIESDEWNLMFIGEIDRSGRVSIPIKKLPILEEGTKGKIKMEVIAEGTVFIPWEDEFEVKLSKKVMVKFNETKSQKPQPPSKPSVKVNVKR